MGECYCYGYVRDAESMQVEVSLTLKRVGEAE